MSFNFTAAVTICSDFEAQENKACLCFHSFPIYLPWSDQTGCYDLCLLSSWLQSPSAVILEPKKIMSVPVSIVSPHICHELMGSDAMILVFRMLNFKPDFSLSSFTFIKRLFSFSLLSAIRVEMSSAYLRLLLFLLAILIPACDSSSLAFCLMYFAYKLNKQGDNIQLWCTPFLIWDQSIVPRLVLIVASWPAYRFLSRQVRRSDKAKVPLRKTGRVVPEGNWTSSEHRDSTVHKGSCR